MIDCVIGGVEGFSKTLMRMGDEACEALKWSRITAVPVVPHHVLCRFNWIACRVSGKGTLNKRRAWHGPCGELAVEKRPLHTVLPRVVSCGH